MCKVWKSSWADYFVNSLKPHWVSLVFMPKSTVIIILKIALTSLRWNFLYTFPYYYYCRLDPTVITSGCCFCFTISSSFAHTLSRSEKVVAPSASTISTLSPWAILMPALTAPPLPLFLGYSSTTKCAPNYLALESATYVVLSFEPSFAMII